MIVCVLNATNISSTVKLNSNSGLLGKPHASAFQLTTDTVGNLFAFLLLLYVEKSDYTFTMRLKQLQAYCAKKSSIKVLHI